MDSGYLSGNSLHFHAFSSGVEAQGHTYALSIPGTQLCQQPRNTRAVNAEKPRNLSSTLGPIRHHFYGLCALMSCQFRLSSADSASFPGRLQSQSCPLPDHAALEFCKGTKHLEHHSAC